jgi:PAS domain S-box-containing protein
MKTFIKYALILFAAFQLQTTGSAQQTQKVKLQLKWKHQFQFAGYYAAIEKGFYNEAGIEVLLIEASEGQNPSIAVIEGKAEFGVCTSDILLMRSQGKPAVVLATIFQHSPQILIASKASGVNNVHDLAGKRIALEPNAADIIAFMNDEGISLDMCTIDHHSFDANGLLNGEIDAISAYSTDELFVVQQANFEHIVISPLMGGIDFYGDVLFTTEQIIRKNPALVAQFREASLKGWVYAMNNPEEIIELIYTKYSTRHSIDHLRFEANHMKKLVMTEVVEPGYTNPGRWKSIANTYKKLKMLPSSFSTKGLLYADYLPSGIVIQWRTVIIYLFIMLVVGMIAYFFFANARKLKNENLRRQQLEEQILESEKKYRILFLDSPDAYLIIIEGVFVDCNRAAEQMMRTQRNQIIGKSPDSISPEFQPDGKKSNEAAAAKINYAMEHGQDTFEWVHRRFNGTEFMVEVSIAAMTLDGKPSLFTTWRDINERKSAEEKLRESEQLYRFLTETMKDVVWTLNTKTLYFNYLSPSIFNLRGYTPEEIKAQPMDAALTPEQSADLKEEMRSCVADFRANKINSDTYFTNEVEQPCKDGKMVSTEVVTCYYLNKKNNSVELHGVTRDITDRKMAEKALKESEEKFREMAELLPQIVFETDMQGKLTYVNRQAFVLLGYPEDMDIKNFSTIDLYIPDDRPRAILNIQQRMAGKKEGSNEYTIQRADGSLINALVYSNPIIKENKPVGLRGIIVDISERKQSERQINQQNAELQKLNGEKDKFFSIIAHDLKSPFNGILGFSNLLVEQVREKDYNSIEKYAQIIQQSSGRAMDLLMNLMEWASSQTGRLEFNPEYFELVSDINELILFFKDIAGQKSISISSQLPSNAPVFADKAMISTILRNLISNAIKFSHPGGEIVISVEENQTRLTISVSDKGVGIPKNSIDKLFRIDENYSTPGTQNEKGTGLGLILCKEFIEKHKGKIWVASEAENPSAGIAGGSSFYFSIPYNTAFKKGTQTL